MLHDGSLHRVAGAAHSRPVSQLTAAEAASIDVGSWKGEQFWGERIPQLSDVLAMFTGADVHLHIVPPPAPKHHLPPRRRPAAAGVYRQ